jgi:hypothetical protein
LLFRAAVSISELERVIVANGSTGSRCQVPSWNENMKCFLDLAINSENIGRPCSRY